MKTSLLWRFGIILTALVLACLAVIYIKPQLGIDLKGGFSLLYELDISKLSAKDQANPREVAERVVEVLKRRINPTGVKDIKFLVVSGKRIQIQMPLPDEDTQKAMAAQDKAWDALDATMLKPSAYITAIRLTGAARDAAISALAGGNVQLSQALHDMATADEKLQATDKAIAAVSATQPGKTPQIPTQLLMDNGQAVDDFNSAKTAVDNFNVDRAVLKSKLLAADDDKDTKAQESLEQISKGYPRQKAEIEAVISAHRELMKISQGRLDDPDDLERLVTSAGVLDFRIAVQAGEISATDKTAALNSLRDFGPDRQVEANGSHARWFAIEKESLDNFKGTDFVTGQDRDTNDTYVLLYDDQGKTDQSHTLTHADRPRQWSTKAEAPRPDPNDSRGGIMMPFNMDPVGAKYMEELTSNNMKHPMAILLDNRAISAPIIQAVIRENGSITFGSPSQQHPIELIKKEANNLKQLMDAGSLPATLQKQPISKQLITADMGKDNIERGKSSAIYAVIAVIGFMFIYYTITGVFADMALMFNLLLVMAAMAFLQATYTLPGIAGLVLTLGMAVDANVLINERIREELHKGASLWMAIKQGYDKVFWTIFDANLTCSLTSIVLIYVGSEEVKGFGVTLLIGLCIHMFTALFVTRTLMMAAVRWGVLRAIDDHSLTEYLREIFTFTWLRNGHFPFMRVITVTKIDWIGKRHIFWVISAIITVAGIVAFWARGEDKYDIEFRGGTQVTFTLHADQKGHFLDVEQLRQRVYSLGDTNPGLRDLQGARVYGVGKEGDNKFEIQTTIKNPPDDSTFVETKLLKPLADTLGDVLDKKDIVTVSGGAFGDDLEKADEQKLEDNGIIRPLLKPDTTLNLDQVFAGTGKTGFQGRDVTAFKGGVAILLDQISPPQTMEQLNERIRTTRQANDFQNVPYREFAIIPLMATTDNPQMKPANGKWNEVIADSDDKRPLTRAVMVSVDPNTQYSVVNPAPWREKVAKSELAIVGRALRENKSFPAVTTFDAGVASQAKQQALLAIILSLVLIVIYVWIRFGGIWYGVGAIFSLVHDAVVALAATVLSGVAYHYIFHDKPNFLLISDFKINLTMIAAYLTIIGYSVNDTIVIFDRVRELRGRSREPLTAQLVNDAINQCFGRTIWTTFTVFIVVLIMYIFGGEGVRGFSFAMLIGVITGAYSTLAIASPMLLTTARMGDRGNKSKPQENPFLRKPALPAPEPAPAPTAFKPQSP